MSIQGCRGIHTMSIGFELGWISPPGIDYIMTKSFVLIAFFSLKVQKKCCIVSILGCRRKLIHYLQVLQSKRADGGLLVTDNASSLNVNVLQILAYHIIIGYNLRS
jgi:hypothetical protein